MGSPDRVELRDVTADDFDAVIALQVADHQRDLLYSNVETIAWAYVAHDCHPLVIYADDKPAGLVSYGWVPADGRCWIVHFMVDERWQRRGVGRAALEQLLARMTAESGGAAVALTVDPKNTSAMRLYEAFGFQDSGTWQNDEIVMRRPPASNPA